MNPEHAASLVADLLSMQEETEKKLLSQLIGDAGKDSPECLSFLIQAGACAALVSTLASVEREDSKIELAKVIGVFSQREDGRLNLIEANACHTLVATLALSQSDLLKLAVTKVMHLLALNDSGRGSLIEADAPSALVAALSTASDDNVRKSVAKPMGSIGCSQEGRFALIQALACPVLVTALRMAEVDETKRKVAWVIGKLAQSDAESMVLIHHRACPALVAALTSCKAEDTIVHVSWAMGKLADCAEGCASLISSGAAPAFVNAMTRIQGESARRYLMTFIRKIRPTFNAEDRFMFIQLLLRHIIDDCCIDNSFTEVTALKSQLHGILQELSTVFEATLASNAPGDFSVSVDPWHFLSRLVLCINCHCHIRSSLMAECGDVDAKRRVVVSSNRVVSHFLLILTEMFSASDDANNNFNEGMSSILMDFYNADDIFHPMKYLNAISRRVIAIKRPSSKWNVTIDGLSSASSSLTSATSLQAAAASSAPFSSYSSSSLTPSSSADTPSGTQHFNTADNAAFDSGISALIAPLQEFADAAAAAASGGADEFDDALCSCCMSSLFECKSDGSVIVVARQLKCVGAEGNQQRYPHIFHAKCAKQWFVDSVSTKCPICRHVFQNEISDRIAAGLEHLKSADGLVVWRHSSQQRLNALKTLVQIPEDTPLLPNVVSALVLCVSDPSRHIADLAHACIARAGRPSRLSLIDAGACVVLLAALSAAVVSATRLRIAESLLNLSQNEEGQQAFLLADAGPTLVAALNASPVEDADSRSELASIMSSLCEEDIRSEDCRTALINAGACSALVTALSSCESSCNVAAAIYQLAMNEDGLKSFLHAGVCPALVRTLAEADDDDTRINVAMAIGIFSDHEEGSALLIGAGVCPLLVSSLQRAWSCESKSELAGALGSLSATQVGLAAVIEAGACPVLVAVLSSADTEHSRCNIAAAIGELTAHESSRLPMIQAGACAALVAVLALAEEDDTRANISGSIADLAQEESGVAPLIEADACNILMAAWTVADADETTGAIANAIGCIVMSSADATSALILRGICPLLVTDLTSSKGYHMRLAVAEIIGRIAEDDIGLVHLMRCGVSEALVSVVIAAESHEMTSYVMTAIVSMNHSTPGCLDLIRAGACEALVIALKACKTENMIADVAEAMVNLTMHPDGLRSFINAGAADTLVAVLKLVRSDDEDAAKRHVANTIGNIAEDAEGGALLLQAGVCPVLVAALQQAETDEAKTELAAAIGAVAAVPHGGASMVQTAGACAALVAALSSAESSESRRDIANVIAKIASDTDGRDRLIQAGACSALVQVLRNAGKRRSYMNSKEASRGRYAADRNDTAPAACPNETHDLETQAPADVHGVRVAACVARTGFDMFQSVIGNSLDGVDANDPGVYKCMWNDMTADRKQHYKDMARSSHNNDGAVAALSNIKKSATSRDAAAEDDHVACSASVAAGTAAGFAAALYAAANAAGNATTYAADAAGDAAVAAAVAAAIDAIASSDDGRFALLSAGWQPLKRPWNGSKCA